MLLKRQLRYEEAISFLLDTEVWAYGSRVKFTTKTHSDLDMVAFASKEQSQAVANLREAFEESYLPFRIDLFVWDEVPEGFHVNIEEARVVVQKEKKDANCRRDGKRRRSVNFALLAMERAYRKKSETA